MADPLRVLLLEDSSDDALLIERELRRGGFNPQVQRIDSERELQQALQQSWDLFIIDYGLPGYGGLAALERIGREGGDTPRLMVSGVRGEELAVEAMRAGAHDFINKGQFARLIPAIERELREAAERRHAREERERLLVELREQRDLFETIIANAPVGMVVFGAEDLVVRWGNEAYRQGLDYPEAHPGLAGMPLTAVLPEEHGDLTGRICQAVQTGTIFIDPEFRMKSQRRGETSWRIAAVPLLQRGTAGEVLLIAVDITEQVQVRRQVEEERSRLQGVLETLPVGVWILNGEGRIIRGNPAALAIWEGAKLVKPEEFYLYKGWRPDGTLIAADEWAASRAIRDGETTIEEEVEIETFGGNRRIVLNSALPIRVQGQLIGAVIVNQDITARKKNEAERTYLLAELEATFASIADALIVFDPGGEILRLNPAAEFTLNHTATQARSRRLDSLELRTSEGEPVRAENHPVRKALRGEVVQGQMFALPRDGRLQWITISVAPICTPDKHLLGAVATFTDITAMRELQRNQEIYTHTISHDLRTPLTVIYGHAQMLEDILRAASMEAEADLHAQAIVTGADRMNAMIEDLVDAARLDGGPLQLELSSVELPAFIEELLERNAPGYDVGRIRVELTPHLPPVLADENRLERMVMNLLSNALKYSEKPAEVRLRAKAQEDEVVVSVIDRGPGIAPEDVPFIFDRFYRPKGGRKGGGVGLGLYISRMLVQAHGGRIWVETTPGTGSTFTFTLPVAAENP